MARKNSKKNPVEVLETMADGKPVEQVVEAPTLEEATAAAGVEKLFITTQYVWVDTLEELDAVPSRPNQKRFECSNADGSIKKFCWSSHVSAARENFARKILGVVVKTREPKTDRHASPEDKAKKALSQLDPAVAKKMLEEMAAKESA